MRLLIAGGGTGGHLFPALAVARGLRGHAPDAEVLFVGTERGIEARVIPESEFPIRFITARGLRGKGVLNALRGSVEIPRAIVQSLMILRNFQPDVVLGVGGYASGPTLAAALMLGKPTAIQEQNSVLGTTNRILSRFVDKVFISWDNTEPAPPREKTLCAGNPVRRDLLASEAPRERSEKLTVLVFGGSQGARSINEAFINNLDTLARLKDRIAIVHQTGLQVNTDIEAKYADAGLSADVRRFIDDMGTAYRAADLVVCRAGAGSLSEITAVGKPAIVVPYPYAIGDHQAKNAAVLESGGAARVIPEERLKNGALVKEIVTVIENPDLLRRMAENSRKLGRPDATDVIVRELIALKRSRS